MFSSGSCVITIGKYQSVNNLCHLLPFYAITVFWSCGLASFTKDSSIQIGYCIGLFCVLHCRGTAWVQDMINLLWTKCNQLWSILKCKVNKQSWNAAKYYFKWTGRGICYSTFVIQPLLHCCARKHSALLFMKWLWCLQLENANLFAAICLIYYHCLQNNDSNRNVRARQFWCQSGRSIDALILSVRTRGLEGFYSLWPSQINIDFKVAINWNKIKNWNFVQENVKICKTKPVNTVISNLNDRVQIHSKQGLETLAISMLNSWTFINTGF